MTEEQQGQELTVRPVTTVAPIEPDQWTMFSKIATAIASTEMVPPGMRGNPPAVAAAFLYGRAQGVDPIIALQELYVVDGKVGASGNFIVGKIRQAGHRIEREVLRAENGELIGVRAYGERGDGTRDEYTFTLEDARRAGLTSKNNWKNYPEVMCTWRAFAQLGRMLFSDVFLGSSVYFYDELDAPVTAEGTLASAAAAAPPATAEALAALTDEEVAEAEEIEPAAAAADPNDVVLTEAFEDVVNLYQTNGAAKDIRAILPDLDAPQLRWVKEREEGLSSPRKGVLNDVTAALMAAGEAPQGETAEPAAAQETTQELPVEEAQPTAAEAALDELAAAAADADPEPEVEDDLPAPDLGDEPPELTRQEQLADLLKQSLAVIHDMYPNRAEWTTSEICTSASQKFKRQIDSIDDMTEEELTQVLRIVPPRIQAKVLGITEEELAALREQQT